MEIQVNLSRFGGPRPLAVVVGHERSGNHFLMNAVAACCGYTTAPYLDLDHTDININFHQPDILANLLEALAAEHTANVLKSHHQYAFFAEVLDELAGKARFLYVYRDPVAVMESFWKFVAGWPWREGPRAENVAEFARAQPSGRLMRYQMNQAATMIERWLVHVSEWLAATERHENLSAVRYEDLRDAYPETMAEICRHLACPVTDFPAPARDDYVKAPDTDALSVSDAERTQLRAVLKQALDPGLAGRWGL